MPRISTYGAPWVGPVQTTNARFRAADNGGGVAGGIADGLRRVGQSLSGYADEQDRMYDRLAQTQADSLYVNAATTASTMLADYKTKAGQDALLSRPNIDKALEDTLNSALSKADPRTKRYLEPQLLRLRASASSDIATHATGALKTYETETGKAKYANLLQDAVSTDDPGKRSDFIAQTKEQARANAVMQGLGGDEILRKVERDAGSAAHAAVVNRYMADKNYDLADAYFKAHAKDMNAGDEASISADLAGPMQKRWASQTVDAMMVLPPISGAPGKGGIGAPVSNGKAVIEGLFPKAYVTDNKRDPNSALGRANPKSWHVKSGGAVDVRPIPGMTFDQFVKEVEGAGYTVIEALNEVGKGRSKHATGDHWHIVLGQGGGGATPAPRRWDMEKVTSSIYSRAQAEGWSIEQRDAVLAEAKERVSLDETLQRRKEDDADRAASEWVISRGDRFTDVSQMPASIRGSLSPDALRSYIGVAKANAKPAEVKANGSIATTLELQRILDPEGFAKQSLGRYVGQMTPAEMQGLLKEQAKIVAGDPDADVRGKVSSTISTFGVEAGLTGNKEADKLKRVRVQKTMEAEVKALTGGKRKPTEDELYKAFLSATKEVTFRVDRTFAGIGIGQADRTKPRYELEAGDVPPNVRQRIVNSYTQTYGQAPNDEQLGEIYRNGKGRYW